MPLNLILKSLDGVDEAVANLYTKQGDGTYMLDVEGAAPKDKLDEFRTNNIKLLKEIDSLKDKFGSIDLDQYQKLLDEHNQNRDKKLIEEGKIDELVEARVAEMKKATERQISDLTGERDGLASQLSVLVVDNQLQTEAVKAGVLDTALPDVLARGRNVFRVENGKAVPYNGDDVVYGKDGSTPMSMGEYLGNLAEDAPHLFKKSSGSGAGGGAGEGSGATIVSNGDVIDFGNNLDKVASGAVKVAAS